MVLHLHSQRQYAKFATEYKYDPKILDDKTVDHIKNYMGYRSLKGSVLAVFMSNVHYPFVGSDSHQ